MNSLSSEKYFAAVSPVSGILAITLAMINTAPYFSFAYQKYLGLPLFYTYTWAYAFFCFGAGFLAAHSSRRRVFEGIQTFPVYILKKLDKLYPPLLISTIMVMIFGIIDEGSGYFELYKTLRSLTVLNWGWVDCVAPYNGPLWFISIILLCYTVFFFISRLDNDGYFASVFLMLILGFYILNNDFSIPFLFKSSGRGYFFFFAGVLLYERLKDISDRKTVNILLTIAIVTAAAVLVFAGEHYFTTGKRYDKGIEEIVALVFLSALFVILVYWKPIIKVMTWKPFATLGKISMLIYFFHVPVCALYLHTLYQLLTSSHDDINYILNIVLTLLFSWAYCEADRKIRARIKKKETP